MASLILQYLQTLVKQKGSDLHIAAHSRPMIRVNGELMKLNTPAFTPEQVEKIVQEITNEKQKKDLLDKKSIDFAIKAKGIGVFRINVFYQRHGLAAVMRALAETPPNIDDLNLPPILKQACGLSNGLVLVTGPTGSGKSTTLASMINYINETDRGHILTLEDPIEFHHVTKKCMVNQRQLGQHFTSFSSALKSALREDPDVILVGEMRDPETIALAITAAETGHLVFATLHTNSAAKSVDRIIDSFPGGEQAQIRSMLSESLRVIASQKLLPTIDKKSRFAVHDILVANPAVSNLIREGKTYQIQSVMQTAKGEGMQVLDQVIRDALKQGIIDGKTAWEFCNDKALFKQYAPVEAMARGGTNLTKKAG